MSFGIHVFSHPSLPRFRGTVRERLRGLRRFPGRARRDRGDCRILLGFRLGANHVEADFVVVLSKFKIQNVPFSSALFFRQAFISEPKNVEAAFVAFKKSACPHFPPRRRLASRLPSLPR